ncbi:hypothetical protein EVAR_85485_1 [Eumeta japonica]|uniref:Uncharacterized protein n=1 Tax=Eumeta variegata TaxID=151549 RepID=A0A4C1VAS1_EUMVA|nr:hypothetical protein EVAR_85485_1 [Eumeta japonica]
MQLRRWRRRPHQHRAAARRAWHKVKGLSEVVQAINLCNNETRAYREGRRSCPPRKFKGCKRKKKKREVHDSDSGESDDEEEILVLRILVATLDRKKRRMNVPNVKQITMIEKAPSGIGVLIKYLIGGAREWRCSDYDIKLFQARLGRAAGGRGARGGGAEGY